MISCEKGMNHVALTIITPQTETGLAWKFNLLPHMPILGSSNSEAKKDMMEKIWINGDTFICASRKHCGKRRKIACHEQFLLFPCFQKQSVVDVLK